jgi:hypothetical protein
MDATLAFVRRFPKDPAAKLARVYLAIGYFENRDYVHGDSLLATLGDAKEGATHDLATVARARSLRLQGAPRSALEALRPLVGKIIDDADREIFLEELALTAIAAHDDYEALAYLDAWLRGVGEEDRERVRTKIAQILQSLPREVLEQTYGTMRQRGVASGYSADTERLVAARLARVAVDANDAALARWLLETSGRSATQTGAEAGIELGELAASRRGLEVVAGRTVGILLPTHARALRDEAADVVRGVSWALDLPRQSGAPGAVRLVTRDDGVDEAGTRAAMEELAGEGASIILAGFDRASSDRASAWSERAGLPVLLLSAPSIARMPRTSAFVVGERTERELAMLGEALLRRGTKLAAFIVDTAEDEIAGRAAEATGLVLLPSTRCDIPLAVAGKPRFPVASWRTSGAQGWLIAGPASCARDVLREIEAPSEGAKKRVGALALTLEAGLPSMTPVAGVITLSAAAGFVPVLATRPTDVSEPDMRAYMERFGARPTYWTALGRDAGMLASAALRPLPSDTTSVPNAVVQRRAIVQAGLHTVRVPLWTSDDKGFGADRVLSRALRLTVVDGSNR